MHPPPKDIAISEEHLSKAVEELRTDQATPTKANPPSTPSSASALYETADGYLMSGSPRDARS